MPIVSISLLRGGLHMARRARATRNRDNAAAGVPASPYIRRAVPFFDILDEEQALEKLVESCLRAARDRGEEMGREARRKG